MSKQFYMQFYLIFANYPPNYADQTCENLNDFDFCLTPIFIVSRHSSNISHRATNCKTTSSSVFSFSQTRTIINEKYLLKFSLLHKKKNARVKISSRFRSQYWTFGMADIQHISIKQCILFDNSLISNMCVLLFWKNEIIFCFSLDDVETI